MKGSLIASPLHAVPMQSQHSSRSIEHPQLAIVQAVFQVPVVESLLQQQKNDRQQFPRRRTNGFARTLLPFLLAVELHQRRVSPINHRQHRLDADRAQPLPPRFVIPPWRVVSLDCRVDVASPAYETNCFEVSNNSMSPTSANRLMALKRFNPCT